MKIHISLLIVWLLLSICPSFSWATELSDLATSMPPGTWARLTSTGMSASLLSDPNTAGGHDILEYSDKAVWDPSSRRVVISGSGHLGTGKTIVYSESTNSWATATPTGCDDFPHNYQNITFNPNNNLIYKFGAGSCTYSASANSWGSIAAVPYVNKSFSAALEYFPERNSLVWADAEFSATDNLRIAEYQFSTGSWVLRFTGLDGGANHMISFYSPVHKVVVVGGGLSSTALHRIDANMNRTQLTAPFPIGIWGSTVFTLDPVSGNFLVLRSNRTFYSYNPMTNSASQLTGSATPPNIWNTQAGESATARIVASPINSYGVVMFVAWKDGNPEVWLYKHTPSNPDTVPPLAPTNLRVN